MRRYDKYGRIIQGKETIADEEFQTEEVTRILLAAVIL